MTELGTHDGPVRRGCVSVPELCSGHHRDPSWMVLTTKDPFLERSSPCAGSHIIRIEQSLELPGEMTVGRRINTTYLYLICIEIMKAMTLL